MNMEQPFELLTQYVQQAAARQAIVEDYREEKESYLVFRVDERYFLLNIKYVLEITINLGGITPLPFSPKWILGLVGSRGDVYSVVDFRWFNQLSEHKGKNSSFIILRDEGMGYILKVDEIVGSGAYDVQDDDGQGSPWIDGVYHHQGQLWQRIDLAALVSHPSFINSIQN